MIIGIGTDILSTKRFEGILNSASGAAFKDKVYTARELEYGTLNGDCLQFWAGKFACKEAVFKALRTTGEPPDSFTDIEIVSAEDGHLEVVLNGRFEQLVDRCKGKVLVTLSHEDDYVVAFAVLEGESVT